MCPVASLHCMSNAFCHFVNKVLLLLLLLLLPCELCGTVIGPPCISVQKNRQGGGEAEERAATLIQSTYRRYSACKVVDRLRRTKAAVRIQAAARGYVTRRRQLTHARLPRNKIARLKVSPRRITWRKRAMLFYPLFSNYFEDLLYPPSERTETGGYTVFTFVCLSVCLSVCVCLCALSPVFNSVCHSDNASAISIMQPISLPQPMVDGEFTISLGAYMHSLRAF